MSDLRPINPINIDEKLIDYTIYKHHPSALVDINHKTLGDIQDGRVEILDPINPISYVLETSALNTAFAIQEYLLQTRKTYAKLANNESDLYRHMSDKDYIGRFSTPAKGKVTFNVSFNDFISKAYVDPVTKDKLLTLPRNLKVSIDNYVFSLMSPIVIRMTEAEVMDVRFDNSLTDDLFPLSTNYIQFEAIRYNQDEAYIMFDVVLPEVDLETKEDVVSRGKMVRGEFNFNPERFFYYIKAYHMTDAGKWEEMLTTHTEDVWDISTPTCVLQVDKVNKKVNYYIPPVYIENNQVQNKIKLVCYTTKGAINVDFGDFKINDFNISYNKIFPAEEMNVTSHALHRISKMAYIRGKVIDGREEKTFEQLKYDVINNNLRPNLPITDNQIENVLRGTQLEPVRNHDVVTGREFLVKTRIPSSVTRYRIARMSLDLVEMKTSISELISNKNNIVRVGNGAVIIPKGTVFEVGRSTGVRILTNGEYNSLKKMSGQFLTRELNKKDYMSTYYHYVLDSEEDVSSLRAYETTDPVIDYINFKDYNDTSLFGINTRIGTASKTENGFRLDYFVDTKIFNKEFNINNIVPYIVYETPGGTKYYLKGKLFKANDGQAFYSFFVNTDMYIDRKERMHVQNFIDSNGNPSVVDISISEVFSVIYLSNKLPNNFVSKEMDSMIRGSFLSAKYGVVTHELHKVTFVTRLKYLYSRIHTSVGDELFKRYDTEVYHKYEETVFDEKGNILHMPNDYVLDEKGNKLVKHKVGDIMLDEEGKPISYGREDYYKYLNLLLLDYKLEVANSEITNEYKDHVRKYINSLILNNLVRHNEDVLERTKSFLTVPNGLTEITVNQDGKFGYVHPMQSFRFNVHVSKRVHEDEKTLKAIETAIIETLDSYLTGRKELIKVDLEELIKSRTKEFCKSVTITKFTELGADYIKIRSDNAEIAVRKRLYVTPEGYDVRDDVDFNYIRID